MRRPSERPTSGQTTAARARWLVVQPHGTPTLRSTPGFGRQAPLFALAVAGQRRSHHHDVVLDVDDSAPAPDLMSLSLEGSVAVVTGGTRGIGLACTVGLATLGATVVIVGRSAENVEVAVEDLVGRGLDAVGQVADVADPAAVRALPARLGPLGQPDLLVCAAGVMTVPTAKTLRTEQQEWDRVMGINLTGVFTTVSTFVPAMAARRSGRVVILSACLGRMSGPGCAGGLAPYRISKAGVNALVRNLAHETGSGSRGVLVDAVCPGHCRTDMGGPGAPRSATQGADSVLWLCTRNNTERTGLLWEDRTVVPW